MSLIPLHDAFVLYFAAGGLEQELSAAPWLFTVRDGCLELGCNWALWLEPRSSPALPRFGAQIGDARVSA